MNFGIIGFGRIARKFVQAIEATDEGKIYALSLIHICFKYFIFSESKLLAVFFGGGCNDGEIIKIRKDRFLADPRNSSH